jgi:ferric-dicitrate binding protein FerR (iron transport regulator)
MNRSAWAVAWLCIAFVYTCISGAENTATITTIEGRVSLLRAGGQNWIDARPNLKLKAGDQVYSREESFAEIVYSSGAIVRLNESTKLTIVTVSEKQIQTKSGVGDVWVNMRKLVTTASPEFELSTPTATAAIRGTVFFTETDADSSTDVSVYDGKVAVGPSDELRKKFRGSDQEPDGLGPGEVPGPEEVPGPYEVTLEQWKQIIAGQRISIRSDGKFAQDEFDVQQAAATDEFVKKNRELDRLAEQKK